MRQLQHFIKDIYSKNRIQYCKKCKQPIGAGINEIFSGYDTTKLKSQKHIVETKKMDDLCDDCYEGK